MSGRRHFALAAAPISIAGRRAATRVVRKFRPCSLAFGRHRVIPLTDNGRARHARPLVIFRKVTPGFRSEWNVWRLCRGRLRHNHAKARRPTELDSLRNAMAVHIQRRFQPPLRSRTATFSWKTGTINRDSYAAATRWMGGELQPDRWDENMNERTFVGLHIPKCAGTSLLDRVRSGLPAEQVFQNTSIIQNFMGGREDFLHLFDKSKLRFVWGHSIHEEMLKFFGPQAVLITGLREPIDRFRSLLMYTARMATKLGNPPPKFAEIIGNTKDPMCRFINQRFPTISGDSGSPADRAMNVIKACSFVYFSDNFDQTTRAICNVMGIEGETYNSNVAPEGEGMDFDIDPSNHRFDLEMYERARERFKTVELGFSLVQPNPTIERFVRKPLRTNVLRAFLWQSSYEEYKSWRALDKVINKRTKQIEQLQSEIDYYKTRMEGSES